MKRVIDLSRELAPPLLGWIVLSVGLGASIGAFGFREHVAHAVADAERQAQAQLDLQRRRLEPARAIAQSPAEIRQLAAGVESRAPWLATLRTIESTAREPVFLRSVSIEPDARFVKVEAEASSFAEVLAFAKELDESEALHPAGLRSHEEVVDPVRGSTFVRFLVVARWNSR